MDFTDPTSTTATTTPVKLPSSLSSAPKPVALPPAPVQSQNTAPPTGSALDDASRSKLDGIVQKMTQNGETSDYIQNVVNDFKSKYGKTQNTLPPPPQNYPQAVATDLGNAAKSIVNNYKDITAPKEAPPNPLNLPKPIENIKENINDIGHFTLRNVGDVAGAVAAPVVEAIPQGVKDFLGWLTSGAPLDAVLPGFSDSQKQAMQSIQDHLSKNPGVAKDFQALSNIGQAVAIDQVLPKSPISELPSEALGLAKKGVSKVSDVVSNIKNKVVSTAKGLTEGKTQEEVLATPESELHTLSAPERKLYFDNQQSQVTEKSSALEAKVKQDLQEKATASQAEAEKLNRDLATASRDKVVELRPKIRTALGNQSQEYRRLVEEELAPHRDVGVHNDELGQFVDNKYSSAPEQAQAVKNKLGINTTPNTSGLPTVNVGEPETTIGKIYDQAKSLREDLGSAAKKGSRTYTADEKLTDDSISTLTDFMKSKGVDLKAARQFWAKYAPIRNQLVAEAKPFLQTETQTKTFANTLSRVAQGNDVNNENFIKEVENLVGEPVTNETKTIVEKLNANEKQAIADKIQAESQKAEIQLSKDKATKALTDQEYEVARKAAQRSIVKKVILTAGGIGVDKTLKKYTGIGF